MPAMFQQEFCTRSVPCLPYFSDFSKIPFLYSRHIYVCLHDVHGLAVHW